PPPNWFKKTLFILTLALIFVFSFAACKNDTTDPDPDPDPRAAYFGTWDLAGTTHTIVTISANKLVWEYSSATYTLEDLTWTERSASGTNAAAYPTGYAIRGKLTSFNAEPPDLPRKEGSTSAAPSLNDFAMEYWYISADRQSLYCSDYTSYTSYPNPNEGPYIKQ
ncbi:MAG: hypothetical protein FWF68_01680, partial [Spirochaetes bacterium]|nr:hypothetical protein [Spirochaetota bacterium]